MIILVACHPEPEPSTDGTGWGDEIGVGVDVITRPHSYLPSATIDFGTPMPEAVGWDVDVHRVDGAPVLAATMSSGFAYETFPTDGRWDTEAWASPTTPLLHLAVGDWPRWPVVMTDGISKMYTLPLVDGFIEWEEGSAFTSSQVRTATLDDDGVEDLLLATGEHVVVGLAGPAPRDLWTETLFTVLGPPAGQNFGYFLGEPGDLTGDGVPRTSRSTKQATRAAGPFGSSLANESCSGPTSTSQRTASRSSACGRRLT